MKSRPDLERLVRGDILRRQDLHAMYGGNRQAAVSPSRAAGALFLFSNGAGASYGIPDRWTGPNEFELCLVVEPPGESWDTASRAIRDHQKAGRRLYLFHELDPGNVRFLGRVELRGHHVQEVKDRRGRAHTAVVFTLRESRLVLDISAVDHSLVDTATRLVTERLAPERGRLVGPVPLPSITPSGGDGDAAGGRIHRRTLTVRFPEPSTIASLADIPLPSGIEIELR
jgi:ribosomal protein S10